jgi:hypothetical protein
MVTGLPALVGHFRLRPYGPFASAANPNCTGIGKSKLKIPAAQTGTMRNMTTHYQTRGNDRRAVSPKTPCS